MYELKTIKLYELKINKTANQYFIKFIMIVYNITIDWWYYIKRN